MLAHIDRIASYRIATPGCGPFESRAIYFHQSV